MHHPFLPMSAAPPRAPPALWLPQAIDQASDWEDCRAALAATQAASRGGTPSAGTPSAGSVAAPPTPAGEAGRAEGSSDSDGGQQDAEEQESEEGGEKADADSVEEGAGASSDGGDEGVEGARSGSDADAGSGGAGIGGGSRFALLNAPLPKVRSRHASWQALCCLGCGLRRGAVCGAWRTGMQG